VIVISGTPGVGKTSVAKALAERLNGVYVNLSELVLKNKLYVEYDYERKSYIIDEEKVQKEIMRISEKNNDRYVIIDSHYGELAPKEIVIKAFIIRYNPLMLARRLKLRGWDEEKIKENVQAEILGVCTINALKEYGAEYVYEIDGTNKSVDEILKEIIEVLSSRRKVRMEFIDWLSILSLKELSKYL